MSRPISDSICLLTVRYKYDICPFHMFTLSDCVLIMNSYKCFKWSNLSCALLAFSITYSPKIFFIITRNIVGLTGIKFSSLLYAQLNVYSAILVLVWSRSGYRVTTLSIIETLKINYLGILTLMKNDLRKLFKGSPLKL